ncbi:MAG: hypothetical protein LBS17_00100 [Actinomycetes bacterium]|jgi:hypothetical protein|nr:hypothetical protein [Actinomycetes bacterium]
MFAWIGNHIGTIGAVIALFVIVTIAFWMLMNNRKASCYKTTCVGCASADTCPMSQVKALERELEAKQTKGSKSPRKTKRSR